MLLFQYQKMEDALTRQEVNAEGNTTLNSGMGPLYLLNKTQLDSFKLEAQAAMQDNDDYDLNFRRHSSKQSVTWPLPSEFYGPFENCTPPRWSVLDKSFPRDDEFQ